MHSDSLCESPQHNHYGVETTGVNQNLLAPPPLERGTPDAREGDRMVGNGYGPTVDWFSDVIFKMMFHFILAFTHLNENN